MNGQRPNGHSRMSEIRVHGEREISAVGLEAEALEGCGVKKTMKELFTSPESHIVFI